MNEIAGIVLIAFIFMMAACYETKVKHDEKMAELCAKTPGCTFTYGQVNAEGK